MLYWGLSQHATCVSTVDKSRNIFCHLLKADNASRSTDAIRVGVERAEISHIERALRRLVVKPGDSSQAHPWPYDKAEFSEFAGTRHQKNQK